MTTTISVQDALQLDQDSVIYVDTRSPGEFLEDNIPDAINIPLFTDEERAMVGTLYKHDQVKAYQEGIDIYTKKVIDFIDQFKKLDSQKKLIIYCWRGGMRSKTIADLVSNLREETYQLIGGYKAFRRVVREELQSYTPPFELLVLQGLAGCGKTDIIKEIHPSIDLEGLAKHRSSLFGALGLHPVSQKMFESRLWKRLKELEHENKVFIEGEAKKIGGIFMPDKLFSSMQKAKTINIVSSIEKRSERIVRDYFTHNEDAKIKEIITKLKVYLSNKVVDELCALVDNKEYFELAKRLLLEHYDTQYTHALLTQQYDAQVNSDDVDMAVHKLQQML